MQLSADPDMNEFLCKLVELHTDENDLSEIFRPLLDEIWERCVNLKLLHKDVSALLESIIFFSKYNSLTWILLKSPYWLPRFYLYLVTLGVAFSTQTLLGRLLQLSPIPNDVTSPSEHFLEPSRQSESQMSFITESVQRQTDFIVTRLHEFLYNIMKVPDAQHRVMYWIGLCLDCNKDRAKMYVDSSIVAPAGFFVNLTHVLLKFCQPFLVPNSNLLIKVDCRYGAIKTNHNLIRNKDTPIHCVGLSAANPMAHKSDNIPSIEIDAIKFKFTADVFFLTHQCYKLGFIKVYEEYHELIKQLQKTSNTIRDLGIQGGADNAMEEIKNKFEFGMRLQLSMKSVLTFANIGFYCVPSSSTETIILFSNLKRKSKLVEPTTENNENSQVNDNKKVYGENDDFNLTGDNEDDNKYEEDIANLAKEICLVWKVNDWVAVAYEKQWNIGYIVENDII
ncbi:ubiquitin conjugation factor E4 A [Hydra vulgaris]|uniref:ubiquitin conjugation factor E4 A n=1 Tax=Hydra vulgaris TaxID=6087 RepID=UPI0032EA0A60